MPFFYQKSFFGTQKKRSCNGFLAASFYPCVGHRRGPKAPQAISRGNTLFGARISEVLGGFWDVFEHVVVGKCAAHIFLFSAAAFWERE